MPEMHYILRFGRLWTGGGGSSSNTGSETQIYLRLFLEVTHFLLLVRTVYQECIGTFKVSPFPKTKEAASILHRKILDESGKTCNFWVKFGWKKIHRTAAITCPISYTDFIFSGCKLIGTIKIA